MFWKVRRGLPDPAALFRRVHEVWLTRAVSSGKPYPRIPVKRVDQGGFDRMMARPGGRETADRWWSAALGRVDD